MIIASIVIMTDVPVDVGCDENCIQQTQTHAMNQGSSNGLIFVCVSEFSDAPHKNVSWTPCLETRSNILLCPECIGNSVFQTSSFHS